MCVNVETEMLRVVSFVKGNRGMAKFSVMPMRVCDDDLRFSQVSL
jgi:hypothetical protein